MKLEELSWEKAKEVMAEAKVALLPVGSTENHGPHLPLGTDFLTACRIAELTCEKGNWLQLPGVPVGISEHHRQFWGTLWVSPEVLRNYVLGIIRSLAFHGLRKVVMVNGHGGNTQALDGAVRILREEKIHAFVYEWWNAIPDLIAELCQLPHDHAGEMEASMILSIDATLVKEDRFQEAASARVVDWGKHLHGVSVGHDTIDFTKTGVVGDPSNGTAEKGIQLADAAADELHQFCKWLVTQTDESLKPKPHAT